MNVFSPISVTLHHARKTRLNQDNYNNKIICEHTYMIKVEWEFSRHRAVQPGFQESGKIFLLPASSIMSTNSCHPAVNRFATVGMLHSKFAEKEKCQVTVAHGGDKGRT